MVPRLSRPAASSGARCALLIILSTSSIQTHSGNTRPLIGRDPLCAYCGTSSARPREDVADFLSGCLAAARGGRAGGNYREAERAGTTGEKEIQWHGGDILNRE